MKKYVKDITAFILGILAELVIYFQMPYLELRDGHGDGFMILLPVFITPVIGFFVGLLIKRKFKWVFPIIPAAFSVPFMNMYYGEVSAGYIIIFLLGTLLGVGIGYGARFIIISIMNWFREHKARK